MMIGQQLVPPAPVFYLIHFWWLYNVKLSLLLNELLLLVYWPLTYQCLTMCSVSWQSSLKLRLFNSVGKLSYSSLVQHWPLRMELPPPLFCTTSKILPSKQCTDIPRLWKKTSLSGEVMTLKNIPNLLWRHCLCTCIFCIREGKRGFNFSL